MKTRNHFYSLFGISLLAAILVLTSCSKSDEETGSYDGTTEIESFYTFNGDGGSGGGKGTSKDNTHAGVVTAGEWCDLIHWDFWSKLMQGEAFSKMSDYWEFYTNNRIALKVTNERGEALAGVNVKLLNEDDSTNPVWETVTDNHGQAECWVGLFQKATTAYADRLRISLNGEIMDGHPEMCTLDSLQKSVPVNKYVFKKSKDLVNQADIAFIVDATGSMSDEIAFLKDDLVDIINKVKSIRSGMKMRTAALFYRDEGDEYVTRHQDFTQDVSNTAGFVEKQNADGGGDYPEAVHTALERMIQDLSWDNKARTRIAFLILDAPAHYESAIINSLHQTIGTCAKLGIKIIPVAASGVDKNTEFMLRFFANATGGTYVFITDDSGVGGKHLEASVGDYKVEQLNNLLIRLIASYTEP